MKCNIPYEYEFKTYFDFFTAANKIFEFDNECQACFSEQLPKGLEGIMTNGNFIISGIPREVLTCTNTFIVSKNGIELRERHIFKIEELKLPILIPVR